MNGGIYNISLAANESVTLELPKGALTIYVLSASYMIQINTGNVAQGQAFVLNTKYNPFTIENFNGGYYTFTEAMGAVSTLMIWSQGLEESQ
tara:strand:+ start:2080 stop:2355 length:276 start_codon:yes stop_codon:yes gene_type:complete